MKRQLTYANHRVTVTSDPSGVSIAVNGTPAVRLDVYTLPSDQFMVSVASPVSDDPLVTVRVGADEVSWHSDQLGDGHISVLRGTDRPAHQDAAHDE